MSLNTKTTPCVRNCCLDQYDVCMGCFRTLEEILHWHELTASEIEEAIDHTKKRRLEHYRLFPDAELTSTKTKT